MTDQIIDLSIATLAKACRGDVKALPSFMVHDNASWPTQHIQLDNRNRIHLRRATFLQVVAAELPVKAGLFHGATVQEFFIELLPHHLQGSDDTAEVAGHKHSRAITLTDEAGRNPGEADYGDPISKPSGVSAADLDAAIVETDGKLGGVRSSALDAPGSE